MAFITPQSQPQTQPNVAPRPAGDVRPPAAELRISNRVLVGEYSVKVTMTRFLPASKGPIQLTGGTTAGRSLNLQTTELLKGRSSRGKEGMPPGPKPSE